MAHLIDKDALVAEIEKRIVHNTKWKDACKTFAVLAANQAIEEDKKILSIIDSFEVKGVDLEKETKEVQRDYKTIDEYEGYFATIYASDIEWIAKHFFELGLHSK